MLTLTADQLDKVLDENESKLGINEDKAESVAAPAMEVQKFSTAGKGDKHGITPSKV